MEKKVEHALSSQSVIVDKNGDKPSTQSVFKLEARRNFNAILQQEVETRNQSAPSPVTLPSDNTSGSQLVRIFNNKILSIANIKKSETSKVEPNSTQNKLVVTSDKLKRVIGNTNPVYTYNPINVNSDSLHCTDFGYLRNSRIELNNRDSMKNLVNEKTEVYRCYLCPYFNVEPGMIAQHWVLVHLPQNVYSCPHCEQSFQTNFEVVCHLKLTHPSDDHRVMIKKSEHFKSRVSFAFKENIYIKDNEEGSEDDKKTTFRMKCHKCGLNCQTLNHLEEHNKLLHIRFKSFYCNFCNPPASFCTTDELQEHIKSSHFAEYCTEVNEPNSVHPNEMVIDLSTQYFHVGIHLCCINCPFKAFTRCELIWHLMQKHDCPNKVVCSRCQVEYTLTMTDIEKEKAACLYCFSVTLIKFIVPACKVGVNCLYQCTLCNVAMENKLAILRHLKHAHSNWKPFGCGHCGYKAIDKCKIRNHTFSMHPDKAVNIVKTQDFKKDIKDIVLKMFKMAVNVIVNNEDFSNQMKLECNVCLYMAKNGNDLYLHNRKHHHFTSIPSISSSNSSSKEFYRCLVCNYQCLDRSCMSRHAKYRHFSTRPHSCPYCFYNNVEKTKVRLHVLSHHPKLPRVVRTNKLMLEKMTNDAKKLFIKMEVNADSLPPNEITPVYEESLSLSERSTLTDPNSLEMSNNKEEADVDPDDLGITDTDLNGLGDGEDDYEDMAENDDDAFKMIDEGGESDDDDAYENVEADGVVGDNIKTEKGWGEVMIEDMSGVADMELENNVTREVPQLDQKELCALKQEGTECEGEWLGGRNAMMVGGEGDIMEPLKPEPTVEMTQEAVGYAKRPCERARSDEIVEANERKDLQVEMSKGGGIKLTIKKIKHSNENVGRKTDEKGDEEIDIKMDEKMYGKVDENVDEQIGELAIVHPSEVVQDTPGLMLRKRLIEVLGKKLKERVAKKAGNKKIRKIKEKVEKRDTMKEAKGEDVNEGMTDENMYAMRRKRWIEEVSIVDDVLEDPKISKMMPVVRLTRLNVLSGLESSKEY